MLITRRLNCIDAASGFVTLSQWPSGAQVEREVISCHPIGFCNIIQKQGTDFSVLAVNSKGEKEESLKPAVLIGWKI